MSGGDDGYLRKTYDLDSVARVAEHYDAWAATYERELEQNGYVTPKRCARALRRFVTDPSAPLVDLGCGTGLSGVALRDEGFTTIDGLDYSQEMLAIARTKIGVYRGLDRVDLSQPLTYEIGEYANACAAGVVNPGHAPKEAIGFVLDILPKDGCFAFSLNDHALEEGFGKAMESVVDAGRATLEFQEHGEHLPGIGLRSTVYVLRKQCPA